MSNCETRTAFKGQETFRIHSKDKGVSIGKQKMQVVYSSFLEKAS